ncbi:MAG: hypothetical protein AB8G96_02605 [Phycisphaerales bacterium]
MLKRLLGLLRETWWLALIVLAFSVGSGIFVDRMLGWMMAGASTVVFLYFAFVRYDDHGDEAARTPESIAADGKGDQPAERRTPPPPPSE